MAFLKEVEHLEDTEHANYSERSDGCVYSKRNDTQQIHYSKEAEHIFLWSRMAVYTEYELCNEEGLDDVFQNLHRGISPAFYDETVNHDEQHTESNHRNENNIEEFSHRSIRTEDYGVYLVLQNLVVPQFFYCLPYTCHLELV